MERDTLEYALRKAWIGGIALQSQYYRSYAHIVAGAASLGYLTSIDADTRFGGVWRLTPIGCTHLFNYIGERWK
jgi:hypothetical protein